VMHLTHLSGYGGKGRITFDDEQCAELRARHPISPMVL
jgi:hypothetical protein